jgi:hypothetical protein
VAADSLDAVDVVVVLLPVPAALVVLALPAMLL